MRKVPRSGMWPGVRNQSPEGYEGICPERWIGIHVRAHRAGRVDVWGSSGVTAHQGRQGRVHAWGCVVQVSQPPSVGKIGCMHGGGATQVSEPMQLKKSTRRGWSGLGNRSTEAA